MVHRKRIQSLARTAVAVLIAVVLGACSASSCPTPTAHTHDPPTRQSDGADSGSILPEIVGTREYALQIRKLRSGRCLSAPLPGCPLNRSAQLAMSS